MRSGFGKQRLYSWTELEKAGGWGQSVCAATLRT